MVAAAVELLWISPEIVVVPVPVRVMARMLVSALMLSPPERVRLALSFCRVRLPPVAPPKTVVRVSGLAPLIRPTLPPRRKMAPCVWAATVALVRSSPPLRSKVAVVRPRACALSRMRIPWRSSPAPLSRFGEAPVIVVVAVLAVLMIKPTLPFAAPVP